MGKKNKTFVNKGHLKKNLTMGSHADFNDKFSFSKVKRDSKMSATNINFCFPKASLAPLHNEKAA